MQRLIAIYPRQLEKETEAAGMILSVLDEYHVNYIKQYYQTHVPRFQKATLKVDGENVPCVATSFVSGKITDKYNIISSMISSQKTIDDYNINFNPVCDRSISRSNHYFAPSLAVKKSDLAKVLKAKKIEGEVKVKKEKHRSLNIIVGNTTNPKAVLFCHYDSIGPGATDNAAGTAVLLKMIIEKPELLHDALFVIAGNEELSYDHPIYWGHGYRIFEKKYLKQLQHAKAIYTVDCVGNGKTTFDQNINIVKLGFPVVNLKKWMEKTYLVYGDFAKLMEVYHSDSDTMQEIKEEYLNHSVSTLTRRIKKL